MTPSGLFGMSVKLVLDRLGRTFATFDARSQDSGHISYGVIDADGRRWFVKTAGDDVDSPGGATRQERAAALRHAAALQEALDHPALVPLEAVIEASDGVLSSIRGSAANSSAVPPKGATTQTRHTRVSGHSPCPRSRPRSTP